MIDIDETGVFLGPDVGATTATDSPRPVSKSTAHRRFLIWSRAVVWGRLHGAVLHRLDDAGLVGATRTVLDTAHVRA